MAISWHFLTHLTYTRWSVNHFANEGYSGRVTSPSAHPPTHSTRARACKSSCPLVMTEREEPPREKRKRKSSSNWTEYPSIPSVCVRLCSFACLFHSLSLHVPCRSVILRDASEGDHLLIHLSPALLPVPPPLSYRWSGLAFPLPTLFVAANRHSGARRVCCWGLGRRLSPLYSLVQTKRIK